MLEYLYTKEITLYYLIKEKLFFFFNDNLFLQKVSCVHIHQRQIIVVYQK